MHALERLQHQIKSLSRPPSVQPAPPCALLRAGDMLHAADKDAYPRDDDLRLATGGIVRIVLKCPRRATAAAAALLLGSR